MAQVDEVAKGVYRICTFEPQSGLNFNQFLIDDEDPALVHTGMYQMYDDVRKAIGEVMDPSRLRYVVVPHFEADECGGMGRFVEGAPDAILACSELGPMVNLAGWGYSGPVRGFRDGDTLELGEHTLRFMETPHVHHWDPMMVFEETSESLFPADLFMQPGDQPIIVRENLGGAMCRCSFSPAWNSRSRGRGRVATGPRLRPRTAQLGRVPMRPVRQGRRRSLPGVGYEIVRGGRREGETNRRWPSGRRRASSHLARDRPAPTPPSHRRRPAAPPSRDSQGP